MFSGEVSVVYNKLHDIAVTSANCSELMGVTGCECASACAFLEPACDTFYYNATTSNCQLLLGQVTIMENETPGWQLWSIETRYSFLIQGDTMTTTLF